MLPLQLRNRQDGCYVQREWTGALDAVKLMHEQARA